MNVIVLTVLVCSVSALAGTGAKTSACEIYSETRPMADLTACMHAPTRERLGLDALERAGRTVEPRESVEARCRMTNGGGFTAS